MRIAIRSRGGNVVLAVLGALYALAALSGLATLIRNSVLARALLDAALQLLLLGTAALGIWFVFVALDNLGKAPHWFRRRRLQ